MKDMQRIEILFHQMNGRFDVFEERFNGLEGRFDKFEQRFDNFEAELRPLLARIPFIERKLDRIKVVVGGHSSQLLNHESRINRLEHRPRLLRDGERDV
jgi:archaellum component FlaC